MANITEAMSPLLDGIKTVADSLAKRAFIANEKPELKIALGRVKNFFGFGKPAKKAQSSSKKPNSTLRTRQLTYNSSFRDTLWEERLKDWQRRHSGVPQSLPRATFQLNKQSSSRHFRSSHRSFRSSHRVRHVRRGRTHVRRRSRR